MKKSPLKKIIYLLKIVLIFGAVVVKICILIKFFNTALHFKFMLIALGTLAHTIIKSWSSHQQAIPQKSVVFNHHDYHFEVEATVQHGLEAYWRR